MSFQNGEKSDPGGPGLPNILQHFGGRGGKVGAYVSLRYTGSVDRAGSEDTGSDSSGSELLGSDQSGSD